MGLWTTIKSAVWPQFLNLRTVGNSVVAVVCKSDLIGPILNYDQSGRIFRALPMGRVQGVRRVSVLSELNVGESAVVVSLQLPDSVQNHLMHMGFVPDARVTVLRRAPAGDPTVFALDGMEIALRRDTAERIHVRNASLELDEEERDLLEVTR